MGIQHREDSVHEDALKRRQLDEKDSANALTFVFLAEQGNFDPTTLAEHSSLFEDYVPGIPYTKGQIRLDAKHDGVLYECITSHGAEHASDSPLAQNNLWQRIADPADEWPEWFPATGVYDQWMNGSKCTHNSKRWISNIDYNVYEPGATGVRTWDEVTE